MKLRLRFAVIVLLSWFTTQVGAAACSVTAVSLAFGNYDTFRLSHTDSTGNIAITCVGKPGELVSYNISLNAGGSQTFASRRMRSAAMSTLNYNIYTNAARSVVWGDGNQGSIALSDSFSLNAGRNTRNYPVYGRTFRRQNVQVGVYTDTIVVTLNF